MKTSFERYTHVLKGPSDRYYCVTFADDRESLKAAFRTRGVYSHVESDCLRSTPAFDIEPIRKPQLG